MKFLKLTPHAVVLANGTLNIKFEKDYTTPIARVEQLVEEQMLSYEVAPGMTINMPINVVTRTTVYGLPEPQEGVIYICSSMVATHVRRPDVIAPITDASCVRDENGRVVSVKGFQTFNHDYKFPATPETPSLEKLAREVLEATAEEAAASIEDTMVDIMETVVPGIREHLNKVDEDMLDPIKAAAKELERQKYLKRMAKLRK